MCGGRAGESALGTVALVVLSAGVAAAACGSQTGGPSTAKAFECEKIRIVEGGKVLAEIGKRDGGVELALFDAAGHARISIGVRKNGTPQTSLLDETEHVRLESVIEPEGAADTRL